MQEIGKRLKEKRESLNVGLEEISLAIKINTKILQALEDGDLSRLPAKPFVRGFVQSYAKYLGLDVKEIMEMFQNTQGTTKPQIPNASTKVEETKSVDTSLPGSGRNILVTIGIALAIIVIVVLQQFLAQREKEMQTDNVQAINGSDVPITIKSSSPVPGDSDTTEKENVLVPLQSPSPSVHGTVTTPTPTPTVTHTPTPTATPTPKPSPSPSPSPLPSPSPSPKPTPTPSVAASPSPSAKPAGPQEIIVEALDKITIQVTTDNTPPKDVELNADQIMTFKAKSKIKLVTPSGGAISIIHNGKELGVPGNLGQPKTMVFPR